MNKHERRARRAYINPPPSGDIPANAPKDAVKVEFARRLQAAMIAKGWLQSELARHAEMHLPNKKRFGRDSISLYIRGKSLPGPLHLKALCTALGAKPEDLLPTRGVSAAGEAIPAFDVRDLSDGNVWLRINQAVPWPEAIKIMQLVKGEA
jgi:transcriptional regulator with XRE-family HTH domain